VHFRFAVLSDPHVTLPETLVDYPGRAHLYELSQAALQAVLADLRTSAIDFLLIPGDLTQNSERANHLWLRSELAAQPFPSYVIPGNHDTVRIESTPEVLGQADFAHFWQDFGYGDSAGSDYAIEILPGVRLLGLDSNRIEGTRVVGALSARQLTWVAAQLSAHPDAQWLVMVHHNLLEHLPFQRSHPLLADYILPDEELARLLERHGVRFVFTGHLHIQDIARTGSLYDITTGSLVSYPHPYRLCTWFDGALHVETRRLRSLPGWPDLDATSRAHMTRGSDRYMMRLLSHPPLSLSHHEASRYAPRLREFWATIAAGDARFHFPDLPPALQAFFEGFNDRPPADNDAVLGAAEPSYAEITEPIEEGDRCP
jgi:3',5'-cyclic AMP phosphodiesterase CpdA